MKIPASIQFSGYRKTAADKVQLFLPGHASAKKPVVEVSDSLGAEPESINLLRQGHYWVSTGDVQPGAYYRFMVDGKPVLDYSERKTIANGSDNSDDDEGTVIYNRVSPHDTPRKSGPILDVFSDALLSDEQLAPYLIDDDVMNQRTSRDHFARYKGNEAGMDVVFDKIDTKNAFRAVLFKPFIGGDNMSAHKYWTVDPFVLNDTFSSKQAFKDTLMRALKRDMKVYADGAFVNQGLNGVQVMSNLQHRYQSPFWEWFNFAEEDNGSPFPELIKHDRMTFGILPLKVDPETQRSEIDFSRFDFRVVNDPEEKGSYHPDRPTYIQLFDPKMGDDDTLDVSAFSHSVQPYRFPVDPKELAQKRRELAAELTGPHGSQLNPELRRKAKFLSWEVFQLDMPSADNSSIKWNGQIDVMKMNMHNPDVRAYIQDAMVYWSRLVMNTYTEEVARALYQPQVSDDSAKSWMQRIEAIQGNGVDDVLPPTRMGFEEVDAVEIIQTLREMPDPDKKLNTDGMVRELEQQFPLSALELPETFKATLSYPGLNKNVYHTRGAVNQLISWVLTPIKWLLSKLGVFGSVTRLIDRYLNANTFSAQLSSTLGAVTKDLSDDAREKLKHQPVRQLLYEAVGEEIFQQLLTGEHGPQVSALAGETVTREQVEEGFYKTVPAFIRMADPVTASALLPQFLNARLKKLDKGSVTHLLEEKLVKLDPEAVAVASMILKKREFGLNWRIDAAKDIGDMDAVLNTDVEERPEIFSKEIVFAKGFWKMVRERLNDIFPKTSIIGELTEFIVYAGGDHETVEENYRAFTEDNTFTSMPNMEYMFSSPCRLVNFEPRPDEFGDRTISPTEYYDRIITKMTTEVPWPVAQNYQNMTASHDYSTTPHRLLLNPELFTMDLLRWHGLIDDLKVAAHELQRKACFAETRKALQMSSKLGPALKKLLTQAADADVQAKLSERVRDYVLNATKEAKGNVEPTPHELKVLFIKELFNVLEPSDLGLSQPQKKRLRDALIARMDEPSETRAMRAVMNNGMETLSRKGDQLSADLGLSFEASGSSAVGELKQAFYRAVDQVALEKGRHFGYQPLSLGLKDVAAVMADDENWTVPAEVSRADVLARLKLLMFDAAMAPVLKKYQRVLALQVALPGNPAVYLPDLLSQSGGEYTKNMFIHNRNLVRHDWLDRKPGTREAVDSVLDMMRLRTDYPVLNDGFVLKPNMSDEDGIVPVIRDNGVDQAIMLVNTGLPSEQEYDNKVGSGALYSAIKSTQPVKKNYKLDVSNLDIEPGTRYRNVDNGKRYLVSADGVLVSEKATSKGIDVGVYALLVREGDEAIPIEETG